MTTLQEMLKARFGGDQRAANAVIDVRGDQVRILFGTVGNNGRIILGVDGDTVSVLYPKQSEEAEGDDAADAADNGESGERRPPDREAGEFVDDRDPLQPGENPADAVARLAAEGENGRQAETVSTTTGIGTATLSDAGIGAPGAEPEGSSEIKNPDAGTEAGAGGDNGASGGDGSAAGVSAANGGGTGENAGATTNVTVGDAGAKAIDPDDHSKDDLLALAKKEGVEVKASETKAEIAAAINKARGA